MRDYIKGFYGEFEEVNDSIPLTITLRIWRRDLESWDECIAELEKDILDAGPDWTGTVKLGPMKRWWLFGGDKYHHGSSTTLQDLLETYFHGTSQDSDAFEKLLEKQFREESPRSLGYNSTTEKKGHFRYRNVPANVA